MTAGQILASVAGSEVPTLASFVGGRPLERRPRGHPRRLRSGAAASSIARIADAGQAGVAAAVEAGDGSLRHVAACPCA